MPLKPITLLALSISIGSFVFASDDAGSARIGLSPQAEKKAQIETNATLFKSAQDGSAEARKNWDELKVEDRLAALSKIAWSKDDAKYREKAIRALAHLSPADDADGVGLKAVASVAVADGDGSMRKLARTALTALDDKRAPKLLAGALEIDDALIKNNAIEAMRNIGGPRVFEIIVEHWLEVWGAGPRSSMFVGVQRSYIADYNISGSSYEPVVRSFMTGVVLDAKVVKVEADVYYVWIREVTNERKLPNDPAAWQKWIKKNEPLLAKQAEKNKAEAVAALKE